MGNEESTYTVTAHPDNAVALMEPGVNVPKPEDLEYVPVEPGDDPNPDYYRVDQETGRKIPITRTEYKQWRKANVTIQHQVIPMCGHKFIKGTIPRHRNCEACWFTFFQVHGELTQAVEEVFQKHGKGAIVQLKGKKFLNNFLKFMSSVAHLQDTLKTANAVKEQDVASTIGTDLSVEAGAAERLAEEARASRAIIEQHKLDTTD